MLEDFAAVRARQDKVEREHREVLGGHARLAERQAALDAGQAEFLAEVESVHRTGIHERGSLMCD